MMSIAVAVVTTLLSAVHDIDDYGAIRADASDGAIRANTKALNAAIAAASAGDTVLVSRGAGPYSIRGSILATNLTAVALRIEGDLVLDDNISRWDLSAHENAFLTVAGASNLTISGGGLIDGKGMKWWDASITGSTHVGETRPNLINIDLSSDLLIERLTLRNSPHFHVRFKQCARVTVRYVTIDVDRWKQREIKARAHARRLVGAGLLNESAAASVVRRIYGLDASASAAPTAARADDWRDWLLDQLVRLLPAWALQPEDLNTDGIDPNGEDFHVHDCEIYNDDDSIAVKPSDRADPIATCSRNMRFENLVLTGFGASIGSVPPNADVHCVRNISFVNISMPGTGKGIYIKSNPTCGMARNRFHDLVPKTAIIEGILYQNVTMTRPFWWPIWIGPQQQHEPGSALGRKCALTYPIDPSCPTQGCATFANITLRDVLVDDPLLSPGVILGNETNPIEGLHFDNVTVRFGERGGRGAFPFGRQYHCEHAQVTSTSGTSPAPMCGAERR